MDLFYSSFGLSKEDIGANIQDTELNICERRLKYYDFSKNVSLYSINNISSESALAINIGSDECCLLVNTDYASSSFDNLGNVTNIRAITDDNFIWEILLKNTSMVAETNISDLTLAINIMVDSNYYYFYDISFSIYEESYIYFQYLGNKMCFTTNASTVIK